MTMTLSGTNGAGLPNYTTAAKNAIVSPPTGALVYDTTLGAVSDYNGSSWDVATVLSQFGSSIGFSGYQKLPSGLIIQWGSSVATTGGSLVTLPIAFPNNYLNIVTGIANTTTTTLSATLQSNTGFTFGCYGASGNNHFWIAIGY